MNGSTSLFATQSAELAGHGFRAHSTCLFSIHRAELLAMAPALENSYVRVPKTGIDADGGGVCVGASASVPRPGGVQRGAIVTSEQRGRSAIDSGKLHGLCCLFTLICYWRVLRMRTHLMPEDIPSLASPFEYMPPAGCYPVGRLPPAC